MRLNNQLRTQTVHVSCGFFRFERFHHLNYYKEIKQLSQKGGGGGGGLQAPQDYPLATTLPALATCDL